MKLGRIPPSISNWPLMILHFGLLSYNINAAGAQRNLYWLQGRSLQCWLRWPLPQAGEATEGLHDLSCRGKAVIHEMSRCQNAVKWKHPDLESLPGQDGTLLKTSSWHRAKWLTLLRLSRMSCTHSNSHRSRSLSPHLHGPERLPASRASVWGPPVCDDFT